MQEEDISGNLFYLLLLEAAAGALSASVVADIRGKVPNAATAATSGLALLMAMAAMVLRSLAGVPTFRLADIPPWFFLALCSSYTFLVWVGQPGTRSWMGVAASLTGLFALLLAMGDVAENFGGAVALLQVLLPPISFGSFLAAATSVHWYMKVPGMPPTTATLLAATGLGTALGQAILLPYVVWFQQNGDSFVSVSEVVALRVLTGVALPAVLGAAALGTTVRGHLRWARVLLFTATSSVLVGSAAAKYALWLTGHVI